MFFIAKKLIGEMLMPLQFSLGLMVLGVVLLWLKRGRRLAVCLVTAGTGLLLIFSNTFVGYHLVRNLEARYPSFRLRAAAGKRASVSGRLPGEGEGASARRALGQAPYIVVLGGGASDDPELPVTDRLSVDSSLRVMEAVEIYRSLTTSTAVGANAGRPLEKEEGSPEAKPRIVLSGGPTLNAVPEAVPMQALAEALGVPASSILLETRSNDTASEAKEVLPVVGRKPFILVTSAYHMPRAMGLFQHLGMRPIPAPAGYMGLRPSEPFVMKIPPNDRALVQSGTAWHERLGVIWEHLRGQL